MVARLLSVAFVCVFNVAAHAQLPSESFSPLNYLGRFYGFGYSDGYHACKDGRCESGKSGSSGSIWKPWESMSTYYGTATAPPSNRVVTQRATNKAPLYSQENCVAPNFGSANFGSANFGSANFGTGAPNFGPSLDVSPQPMYQAPQPMYQAPQPMYQAPQPMYQAPPQSLPKWSQTPQPSYESVPPAPRQSQPSPSDRNKLELSAPQKPELVPPSPKVEPRDVSSN